MTIIDGLIWSFIIAMPLHSYFTYQAEIKAIESGKKQLSTSYWQTIVMLWPPAILALFSEHFTYSVFGNSSTNLFWSLLVFSLVASLLLYGIYQVKHSSKMQHYVEQQMAPVSWIMPKNQKQLTLYLVGVCVSAGVAEEFIYRGYLLPFLSQYLEHPMALLVAAILFGLPHIYQKFSGVIKTALMGGIFCLMVIIFDSLILAIMCHFAIDAYSGYIYYLATNRKNLIEVNQHA